MNKGYLFRTGITLFLGILFLNLCCGCQNKSNKETEETAPTSQYSDEIAVQEEEPAEPDVKPEEDIPYGVKALLTAYPDFVKGYEDGEVIFSDGTKMIYDDGRQKNFTDMLDNSSLKDMFYVAYNGTDSEPSYQSDAGRVRNEAIFKKMYGSSKGEVSGKLVNVDWFGQKVPFTKVNGAAEQLKKAAEELAAHPELRKYLKSSGSFYWRNVRGANRLSAHSYGIAIDLGVDHSDYWLWKYPGASEDAQIKYVNRFPVEIAKIMEKYGFIWGGGWYHFDTMHFEYRPEILEFARLSKN